MGSTKVQTLVVQITPNPVDPAPAATHSTASTRSVRSRSCTQPTPVIIAGLPRQTTSGATGARHDDGLHAGGIRTHPRSRSGDHGPTNPALPPPSPEDIELTPQGIQNLPSLPLTGDIEVSGDLGPEQTWATYKMAVGPTTGRSR